MGEVLNFTRDTERYKYFVPESKEHQAKLELRTFKWLVERYTQPGDWILDPMSGIGTVHYAATMGRNTIAIEISPRFVEIQHMNISKLGHVVGIGGTAQVVHMDCRRAMPYPPGFISVIITSPPYGSVQKAGTTTGFVDQATGKRMEVGGFGYDDQDANIGNITVYPLYLEAMKQVYKLCTRSLGMGQRLILITKDYIQYSERVFVTKDNIRVATEVGFLLEDWHLRRVAGGITKATTRKQRIEAGKDKPELNIDTEDILVFTKVYEV